MDTYDTLTSGVPNAITVFNELRAKGYEPTGIRLDSGDLAFLSRQARKMLDEAVSRMRRFLLPAIWTKKSSGI